jgi:hypothetical protein
MTVTIVPVIPSSRVRASSGVPWNASGERDPMRTEDSAAPAARAASTDSVGSTHSDPRTYSLSTLRVTMPASAIRSITRSACPAGTPQSPGAVQGADARRLLGCGYRDAGSLRRLLRSGSRAHKRSPALTESSRRS